MRYRFSLFTTVLTFIVLVLGVLVVATESGDACGFDWPVCGGKLYPDITNPQQVIEWTHRLVTLLLGFVILFNSILAFMKSQRGETAIKILAPLSLVLLVAQALVGGLNVLMSTPPGFTTIDVVLALALFSSLVFLTVALHRKPTEQLTDEMRATNASLQPLFRPAFWTMLAFYIVVIIGAFFQHSAASQIVLDITHKDRLFESFELSKFIYVVHAILGITIVVMIFRVIILAIQKRVLVAAAVLLGILFSLEALIGFVTFATKLAVLPSSIHTLMASLIMGVGSLIVAKAMLGDYVQIPKKNG